MRRRQSLCVLGGAAASWPTVAGAQQQLKIIGFLRAGGAHAWIPMVASLEQAAPDPISFADALTTSGINGETLWMRTIAWIQWRDGCGMRDSGARPFATCPTSCGPHPSPRPTQRKRFIIGLRSQYMAPLPAPRLPPQPR